MDRQGLEYLTSARAVFTCLAELQEKPSGYDQGGIVDPLDGRVMGEHYSTQFFALLGALLLRVEDDAAIFEQVRSAIAFHVRTSKDEYSPGDWAYHWDFNNYAALSCYELLAHKLSADERDSLRSCILSWKENRHKAVNWILMRAHNAKLRHMLFKKPLDILRYHRHMHYAIGSQLKDGCLDDERGSSRPIQYHAYSAALLFEMYLLNGSKVALRAFGRALNYLCLFFDPDGDFNYLGRGQEQIFGYGCALYVLEAGKRLMPEHCSRFDELLARCWSYLSDFQTDDGCFPLVLNHRPGDRRYGWYDYHHSTVYNAFLGVWLAKAFLLRSSEGVQDVLFPAKVLKSAEVDTANASGVEFCNTSRYFFCLAAGQPSKYLSDCGLVFQQLYVYGHGALVSCPGGPGGPEKKLFAQRHCVTEDVMRNFSAPLARISHDWVVPAGGWGDVKKTGPGEFLLTYSYGRRMKVTRLLTGGDETISIKDTIETTFERRPDEMRLANMPLVTAGKTFSIRPNGLEIRGDIVISVDFETDVACDVGMENLKTAKGDVTNLYYRLADNDVVANAKYTISTLIKITA